MSKQRSRLVVTDSKLQRGCSVKNINVDLSGLADDEQIHITKILTKAVGAEQKASMHCRNLLRRYNSECETRAFRRHSSSSAFRSEYDAVADSAVQACCQCGETMLKMPVKSGTSQVTCAACLAWRAYCLLSGAWQQVEWKIRVPYKGGWGLALACGLETTGGMIRTYVCQVMSQGPAADAGIMLGDEILYWDRKDVIGLTHASVSRMLQRHRSNRVLVRLRRLTPNEVYTEFETVLYSNSFYGDSSDEYSLKTAHLLCDPSNLVLPTTYNEVELSIGKGHLFPFGRMQLRLNKIPATATTFGLNVEVMRANYLPAAPRAKLSEMLVTLHINSPMRVIERETKRVMPVTNFAWCETISAGTFSMNDKLKVTVVNRSTIPIWNRNIPMATVLIDLTEAKLDGSSQWYVLHSPQGPSILNLQRPSDILLDDIYLQQWDMVTKQLAETATPESECESTSPEAQRRSRSSPPRKYGAVRKALEKANKISEALSRQAKKKKKKSAEAESQRTYASSAPTMNTAAALAAIVDWQPGNLSVPSGAGMKGYGGDSDSDREEQTPRLFVTRPSQGDVQPIQQRRRLSSPLVSELEQQSDSSGVAYYPRSPLPSRQKRVRPQSYAETDGSSLGSNLRNPLRHASETKSAPCSPVRKGVFRTFHKIEQKVVGSIDRLCMGSTSSLQHLSADVSSQSASASGSQAGCDSGGKVSRLQAEEKRKESADFHQRPRSASPAV